MKRAGLLLLALAFAACSSSDARRLAPSAAPGDPEPERSEKFVQAAATPLVDLNIIRAEIPEVLIIAQNGPYEPPRDASCEALAAEIGALDAALGADLDQPATKSDPGLLERSGEIAEDAAVDVVRGASGGLVPFRSWVRKLTGAERYSREVNAAITAGAVRRAYLKGLGRAAGCQPPASPRE